MNNATQRFAIFLAVALAAPAGRALAQPAAPAFEQRGLNQWLDEQRSVDDVLDEERAELAPLTTFFNWQWGGWLEYYVFSFDDGVQSHRVLQRPGLSLWTRLKFDQGAHEIFARMRLNYEYYNPGDEYLPYRQQDWVGPNLDRGWYYIDVLRALRLQEPGGSLGLEAWIGRQEARLGAGYVLDLPLDAVRIDARALDFEFQFLLGKTIDSYPNLIERSVAALGEQDRHFFGFEARYDGFDRHVPFFYMLFQNDEGDERPEDFYQSYGYDSEHFGFGSRGQLAHNLHYWAEFVYEGGRSFGDGAIWRQDKIDAWGLDVGVEKLWDHPTRPRVTLEYMFGSGDGDRRLSPIGAAGGNRGDRVDSGFATFGYRDTGIAANLLNSNLHVWKLGGSFVPAPQVELLRDLELGTNAFLYHKHQRKGAISDPTADTHLGYVGWEMDWFANWRLTSDLSWTIRWGMFFPGDAYSDQSSRHMLFTGLTWSF